MLRVDARYRVVRYDEGFRLSTGASRSEARDEKARLSSTQMVNPAEDRRGGGDDSDEDSVRTLSSYEDFAERRLLEPLAWSTYQCEATTWFLAFSRLDGSALRAGPLNTEQAAAWFLHVHAQHARPGCLQEAFAALPWQVRVAVLESPVTTSVCPLPQRAVLHMQGVLARAGCELSSNIFCCSRTVSSLYSFVWPKAS